MGLVVHSENREAVLSLLEQGLVPYSNLLDAVGVSINYLAVYDCSSLWVLRRGQKATDDPIELPEGYSMDSLHHCLLKANESRERVSLRTAVRDLTMDDACRAFRNNVLGDDKLKFPLTPCQGLRSSQTFFLEPGGHLFMFSSTGYSSGEYVDAHVYVINHEQKTIKTFGYGGESSNPQDILESHTFVAGDPFSESSLPSVGESVFLVPQRRIALKVKSPRQQYQVLSVSPGRVRVSASDGVQFDVAPEDLEKAVPRGTVLNHKLLHDGLSESWLQEHGVSEILVVLSPYNFAHGSGLRSRMKSKPGPVSILLECRQGHASEFGMIRLDNFADALDASPGGNKFGIVCRISVLPSASGGLVMVAAPAGGPLSFDKNQLSYECNGSNMNREVAQKIIRLNSNAHFVRRLPELMRRPGDKTVCADDLRRQVAAGQVKSDQAKARMQAAIDNKQFEHVSTFAEEWHKMEANLQQLKSRLQTAAPRAGEQRANAEEIEMQREAIWVSAASGMYPLNRLEHEMPPYTVRDEDVLGPVRTRAIQVRRANGSMSTIEPGPNARHADLRKLQPTGPASAQEKLAMLYPLFCVLSLQSASVLIANMVFDGTLEGLRKEDTRLLPYYGAKRGIKIDKADINRCSRYRGDMKSAMEKLLPARGAVASIKFAVTMLRLTTDKHGAPNGIVLASSDEDAQVSLKYRPAPDKYALAAMTDDQYDVFQSMVCLGDVSTAVAYLQKMTSLRERGVHPLETAFLAATAAHFAGDTLQLSIRKWARQVTFACSSFLDPSSPQKFLRCKSWREYPQGLRPYASMIWCALTHGTRNPLRHLHRTFVGPAKEHIADREQHIELLRGKLHDLEETLSQIGGNGTVLDRALRHFQDHDGECPPVLICQACASGNQRAIFSWDEHCQKMKTLEGSSFLLGRTCDARGPEVIRKMKQCSTCRTFCCPSFMSGDYCFRHAQAIGRPLMPETQYLLCHICPTNKPVVTTLSTKPWRTDVEKPTLVLFTRRTERTVSKEKKFNLREKAAPALALLIPSPETGAILLPLENIGPIDTGKSLFAALAKSSLTVELHSKHKAFLHLDTGTTLCGIPIKQAKRGIFALQPHLPQLNLAALAYAGVQKCLENPHGAATVRLELVRLLLGLPCEALTVEILRRTKEYQQTADPSIKKIDLRPHPFITNDSTVCIRQTPTSATPDLFACVEGGSQESKKRDAQKRILTAKQKISDTRRQVFVLQENLRLMLSGEIPCAAQERTEPYYRAVELILREEPVQEGGADDESEACSICFGKSERKVFVGTDHPVGIHSDTFCALCCQTVLNHTLSPRCPICRVSVTFFNSQES